MSQENLSQYCSEESCRNRLERFLEKEKPGVAHFYRDDQGRGTSNLEDATARASRLVRSVVEDRLFGDNLRVKELAKDLAVLALYDMAILIDDSGSMVDEEGGDRTKTLKGVLGIINDIYRHAAEPEIGIRAIRFINNQDDKDNFLGNPDELVEGHYFGGTTKIGTELHKRIVKPLVLGETPMKKPLLIMVITDGAIEGEKKGLLEKVIISCVNKLNKNRDHGADSVAFQFSCIGNDEGARKVLEELDDHQVVGTYVDCQKASQVLNLSERHLTVPKLLLGAILPKYDEEEDDSELDMTDDSEMEDSESAGGSVTPSTRPGNTGGNLGDSNGSNNHNTHIPQGRGREQGGFSRVAPESQFTYNSQANPHHQPPPPAQNQGAPYPQGNSQSFPYQPEANPNPGSFGPVHSQPHFQENTSEYPSGSPNSNQGPHPGQAYPGFAEAQRARMDGQNIARGAQEEARRAVEEGRRKAEEDIRTSFSGLGEGVRSPMSQEELDEEEEELREEREDAESERGHGLRWHNADVD